MIRLQCDVCNRIADPTHPDIVTDGRNATGERVDICGPCMREAADRVLARLRASVRVLDPVPEDVRSRALSIRLPERLRRSGQSGT